jgi:hypothetical protein
MTRAAPHGLRLTALAIAISVTLTACGGTASSAPTQAGGGASAGGSQPAPSGSRPSSPATVSIVQPASGSTVSGTSVHVVLSLQGAQIVSATTTNIRPDQGHLHLYVDNVLFSMNYGLEQDLPVTTGTYVLKAEFVAADHAPFNPRVWSPEVFFTVK